MKIILQSNKATLDNKMTAYFRRSKAFMKNEVK